MARWLTGWRAEGSCGKIGGMMIEQREKLYRALAVAVGGVAFTLAAVGVLEPGALVVGAWALACAGVR